MRWGMIIVGVLFGALFISEIPGLIRYAKISMM